MDENIKFSRESFDKLLQQLKACHVEVQERADRVGMAANLVSIENAWQRIHHERKKQGLTLQELCEKSGVAYATLSKLESGSLRVRVDILQKVLQTLNLQLWLG